MPVAPVMIVLMLMRRTVTDRAGGAMAPADGDAAAIPSGFADLRQCSHNET
jgi:hypothetical protein